MGVNTNGDRRDMGGVGLRTQNVSYLGVISLRDLVYYMVTIVNKQCVTDMKIAESRFYILPQE
jgi:hypothetical protein